MAGLTIEKRALCEPVALDEMKNFLRVEFDNDNDLIEGLIAGVREACEKYTYRCFITTKFRMTMDTFPYFIDSAYSQGTLPSSYNSISRFSVNMWNYSQLIKILRPPLVSVDRISYLASADQQWHDMIAAPPLWYPGNAYTVGQQVMDNNCNVQQCTTAGTSDGQPPTWNPETGGSTNEANPDPEGEGTGVVWLNKGLLPPAFISPNSDGSSQQFGAYIVDNVSEPGRIFPGPPGAWWPAILWVPNSVHIHFTAGYGPAAINVPSAIRAAIKQGVAHYYENREPVGDDEQTLPGMVKTLLNPFKIYDWNPTRG